MATSGLYYVHLSVDFSLNWPREVHHLSLWNLPRCPHGAGHGLLFRCIHDMKHPGERAKHALSVSCASCWTPCCDELCRQDLILVLLVFVEEFAFTGNLARQTTCVEASATVVVSSSCRTPQATAAFRISTQAHLQPLSASSIVIRGSLRESSADRALPHSSVSLRRAAQASER